MMSEVLKKIREKAKFGRVEWHTEQQHFVILSDLFNEKKTGVLDGYFEQLQKTRWALRAKNYFKNTYGSRKETIEWLIGELLGVEGKKEQ